MRTLSNKFFTVKTELHSTWAARVESESIACAEKQAIDQATKKQAAIESLISQLVELSDSENKAVISVQLHKALTIQTRASDNNSDFQIIVDKRKANKQLTEIESAVDFADIKAKALLFKTNLRSIE